MGLLLLVALILAPAGANSEDFPVPGKIEVLGPPGTRVLLDGQDVGVVSPDSTLTLSCVSDGAHTIAVLREGCVPQRRSFWLRPGRLEQLRVKPWEPLPEADSPGTREERRFGSLSVESAEQSCVVLVPELGLSKTTSQSGPWRADSLQAGKYSGRILVDGLATEFTLDVRPEMVTHIVIGLGDSVATQRFESLTSSSGPEEPDASIPRWEALRIIHQAAPEYPQTARDAELEGAVFVQATVNRSGDVVEAEVRRGILGLNEAATEAVLQWKFAPAVADDRPPLVNIVLPVRFTLRG